MDICSAQQVNQHLTAEEYDFYHLNGYLVVRNLFSHEACDKIYEIFRSHADEKFSAIINLDRSVDYLHSVIRHPPMVSIVEGLFKHTAYALMTQMLFKEANTEYANQSWNLHQDNAYHGNPHGNTLTINLAVKDASKENGCLFLYPGSHQDGLLPFEPKVSFREGGGGKPGNPLTLPSKYEGHEVYIEANKGDVLFLHGNCIHGSYANLSDMSRPMFSTTYIKKGDPFFVGKNANRKEIDLH